MKRKAFKNCNVDMSHKMMPLGEPGKKAEERDYVYEYTDNDKLMVMQ